MTPTDLQTFTQAIDMAQSGQKVQANAILKTLAIHYHDNPNLLLWLAFTASDLRQARVLLDQLTQIDPKNTALPSAYSWLVTEEAKQTLPASAIPATVSTITTTNPVSVSTVPDSVSSTTASDYLTATLRDSLSSNKSAKTTTKSDKATNKKYESGEVARLMFLVGVPVVMVLAVLIVLLNIVFGQ